MSTITPTDREITDRQLAEARETLEEAEADLAELAPLRRLSRDGGAALAGARARRDQAQAAIEHLTALLDQQDAEGTERPKREKAAAAAIKAADSELKASHARVTAAAIAAQAALVELADAVDDHNARVRSHGAALVEQGLALRDAFGDHETGGERDACRVKGRWSLVADPGLVLAWVVHRVAAARLVRNHRLALLLQWWGGRPRLDARTDGLLAAVPDVPEADRPAPLVIERAEVAPAPVYQHPWQVEEERRIRQQEEKSFESGPMPSMDEVRRRERQAALRMSWP